MIYPPIQYQIYEKMQSRAFKEDKSTQSTIHYHGKGEKPEQKLEEREKLLKRFQDRNPEVNKHMKLMQNYPDTNFNNQDCQETREFEYFLRSMES